MQKPHIFPTIALLVLLLALSVAPLHAETPWPAAVENFVEPSPGEHPRLFFRSADIPKLRERAQTPFGQALITRLRKQLDGAQGETPPPEGAWTMSSVAGYGFLYILTGEQKYADLGQQAMEQSFAGATYAGDTRYAFVGANGALRAGPALGWHALGYDLCYQGWSAQFRERVRDAIQYYDDGDFKSLEELARGSRHNPASNHWGMQVGGAALALLALKGDPGVDMARLQPLLEVNRQAMIRKLSEGYGDGGYFAEGDGTGSMGYIAFIPALQAYRIADGRDYVSPRPNGKWITRRWLLGSVVNGNNIIFHKRDGYPHNVWDRDGISGGNYFGISMGVCSAQERLGWLWLYQQYFQEKDAAAATPYDTLSYYPHHTMLSFVNWALGETAKNPAEVMPLSSIDHKYHYGMFRNRWKDKNDLVITFLAQRPRSATSESEIGPIWITESASIKKWGSIRGKITSSTLAQDGSAIVATDNGSCLAIDFSRTCGTDGLLVLVGPGAPTDLSVDLHGTTLSFRFLGAGTAATPVVEGSVVRVGEQTVSYANGLLVLGHLAPPAENGEVPPTPPPPRWITLGSDRSLHFSLDGGSRVENNPARFGPVGGGTPHTLKLFETGVNN